MFAGRRGRPYKPMQSHVPQKKRCIRVVNISLHAIGKPTRALLASDEEKWWLSPAVFESIIDVISEYKNVRLSIDDGNRSDVEIVLPALLKRDMKASFFIPVGKLDSPGYLTHNDVQHLSESGMLIGTHGMYHRNWTLLNDEELTEELLISRDILEQLLGKPVLHAAIPFGAYDRRVLRHLHEVDFERVYNSDTGLAKVGAWLQPRETLQATDSPETVRAIINQPAFGTRVLIRVIKKTIKRLR